MITNTPIILVVDDEIYNYRLISDILHRYNVNVLYANCGSEAIEQCMKNSNISLIFMDIRMKGMNGFEVAEKIYGFRRNIPIVFQTAYAKDFLKDDLMISMDCGYLEKPIKKDMLINEVKKHINLSLKLNADTIPIKKEPGFSFRNVFSLIFS
jgi:CheY-like chemotaxis protein